MIFVDNIINKILSRDLNLLLMWSCDQNLVAGISTREVIITLILYGFDQKNWFFLGVVLV